MINPIRIKTTIGLAKVLTIYSNGKWHTLAHRSDGVLFTGAEAPTLLDAGQNHLRIAYALREKEEPAKNWQERAERDGGFIDDDMGCGGDGDL